MGIAYVAVSRIAAAAFVVAAVKSCGPPADNARPASKSARPTPTVQASSTDDDGYDIAKMDLNPPPAAISGDRHTGDFAQGSALSRFRSPST